MEMKPAYGIAELAKAGPLGRSSLYKAIKERRLVAQKAGRRTIITHDNYQAFLKNLPVIGKDKGGRTEADRPGPMKRFGHEETDTVVVAGDPPDREVKVISARKQGERC